MRLRRDDVARLTAKVQKTAFSDDCRHKFRKRIDESIRVHDKLLLILSESSIKSSWVESEVESAFEREDLDHVSVLFPIRLDDTIMNTSTAWAATIRRTRHIGDFRSWKEHDAYLKAFECLVDDLKSSKE